VVEIEGSKDMSDVIHFYATDEAYGSFSNHAPFPIKLAGQLWPTVEHFFQAKKFHGTPHEEVIRQAPTSQLAAELGRDRSQPLRADWSQAKDNVMRDALRAKFTQHPELREQLLATGNATLAEHTVSDLYWGDGGDGTGKNMLGRMLMELRAELKGGQSVSCGIRSASEPPSTRPQA
jgi:ribA/ribD-fused uncharacterized protein